MDSGGEKRTISSAAAIQVTAPSVSAKFSGGSDCHCSWQRAAESYTLEMTEFAERHPVKKPGGPAPGNSLLNGPQNDGEQSSAAREQFYPNPASARP